jgi:hypothetical protein
MQVLISGTAYCTEIQEKTAEELISAKLSIFFPGETLTSRYVTALNGRRPG